MKGTFMGVNSVDRESSEEWNEPGGRRRLDWILSQIQGERVLNVECGRGGLAMCLGRAGKKVVGIDSKASEVKAARKNLKKEPGSHQNAVDFIVSDPLSFSGGKDFDAVVITGPLNRLPRPGASLEALSGLLAPGGRLLVATPLGFDEAGRRDRPSYLKEPYDLISESFSLAAVRPLGGWLGLTAVKREAGHEPPSWLELMAALEDGFGHLELSLRDRLRVVSEKLEESSERLREMEGAKPQDSSLRMLDKRLDLLRGELATAKELGPLLLKSEERLAELDKRLWQSKEEAFGLKEDLAVKERALDDACAAVASLEARAAEAEAKIAEAEGLLSEKSGELQKALEKITQVEDDRATQVRNLAITRRKLRESEERLAKARQDQQRTRETISFQLGYALTHAHTSLRSFFGLPLELWRISDEAAARRKKKKALAAELEQPPAEDSGESLPPSAQPESDFAPALSAPGERLRMAVIMDQFTYNSYAPEADIIQLTPDNWAAELAEFKPDLLFVESAWEGEEGLWKTKISGTSAELRELFEAAGKLGIPRVFWSKEDPVHYATFLETARLADYVFTTDADCIPGYKKNLGHGNVFLLPFAAQPAVHNPIEKYERKKAFNFAGSYYLRYPERQRNFETLINAAKDFLPVEIYDRNYGKNHPHYIFPERYAPMILGTLSPDEIDLAYKGYEFGININTIKQSQTMFARRAFELLASNTLVISNYSHGLRSLLGDLVLSSDDEGQLRETIRFWLDNDLYRRKLRLLGLRKIMSEHTYARRVQYIRERLGDERARQTRPVYCLAAPETPEQMAEVQEAFARQSYPDKHLLLLSSLEAARAGASDINVFKRAGQLLKFVAELPQDCLLGVLQPQDYYGSQYLFDLALGFEYSGAGVCGKKTFYEAAGEGEPVLKNDGGQYRFTDSLPARASLARWTFLKEDWLKSNLGDLKNAVFQAAPQGDNAPPQADGGLNNADGKESCSPIALECLATDEFNYIKNGASLSPVQTAVADDLHLTDQGVGLKRLEEFAGRLPDEPLQVSHESGGVLRLDAAAIYGHIKENIASGGVRGQMEDDLLLLRSTLTPQAHKYVYFSKALTRKELNLETNSQFKLVGRGLHGVDSVFVYLDADGNKLGHTIQQAGGKINTLPIPHECTHIRAGLKITGPGKRLIKSLELGSTPLASSALVCQSPYLVLTKQYPAYVDIYRYGFLHSRVRAYKAHGLPVNIFRLCPALPACPYHEFEGIEVASGTIEQLESTLRLGQVKHVLVHLLDRRMWSTLKPFLDQIRVTVWIHGAEIQPWQRRIFEFERLSDDEVARQKKLSDKRMELWREIMREPHPNLTFVFVSNIFKDQCFEDIGLDEPAGQVEIVHNYIDGSLFDYKEKKAEDRLRLLSIRPYASNKYANDLTVKAIVELSKRPCFQNLFFHLVGDGEMFEEITAPVKDFKNVNLDRRLLPQWEISRLHNEYGVFLTPTRMDSQGVSRDEAMASGLVPITNMVESIPEFIDENCALGVPAEDYKAMADAVEKLYNDPDLFLKLSQAASERVRRQSGFEQTIQREMDLITNPQAARSPHAF